MQCFPIIPANPRIQVASAHASLWSRVGVVVGAQCVPSSIPRLHVTCGPSLLVLYPAPRGFSPGIPVSPFTQISVFELILYSVPN